MKNKNYIKTIILFGLICATIILSIFFVPTKKYIKKVDTQNDSIKQILKTLNNSQLTSKYDSDEVVFNDGFFNNPVMKIGDDIIIFKLTKDTIAQPEIAVLSDTNCIWVSYEEHGYFDFWERGPFNWNGLWQYQKSQTPHRDQVYTFFKSMKQKLYGLVYFNAYSLVRRHYAFNQCGFCPNGKSYLFKIKRTLITMFFAKTRIKYKVLKNYYWCNLNDMR